MAMVDWTAGSILLGLLALVGIAYLVLAVWHVAGFRRAARPLPGVRPPVSVLKPLCGAEPRLYQGLRSFLEQDYPDLQIVFGVRDADDPAVAVVERLRRDFPHRASHELRWARTVRACRAADHILSVITFPLVARPAVPAALAPGEIPVLAVSEER